MTERDRQDIEYYIPGEPDPSLSDGEYYFLQYTKSGERVIRVFALDILPHHDGIEYGIYQKQGYRLKWIDGGGYGDPTRGARMAALYDNKEDCRNQTHMCADWWPTLRELQMKERREAENNARQTGHDQQSGDKYPVDRRQ